MILPTTTYQGKAKYTIVPLGRVIDGGELSGIEEEKAIAKELTALVSKDLRRGDMVRVVEFEGDDDSNCYRNEGLFIFNGRKIIPLDISIDEYGHIPEEFSYPEFPVDYWSDIVTHNTIVPVDLKSFKFTEDDVHIFSLKPTYYDEVFEVPFVETDNFLIICPLPLGEPFDRKVTLEKINSARHVAVAQKDDTVINYYNKGYFNDWDSAEYENFDDEKTILSVVAPCAYDN